MIGSSQNHSLLSFFKQHSNRTSLGLRASVDMFTYVSCLVDYGRVFFRGFIMHLYPDDR